MKTKEELNALKAEIESPNRKLHELADEELAQVSGGNSSSSVPLGNVNGGMAHGVGSKAQGCGSTAYGNDSETSPINR